jgi:hypothetical protein
MPRKALAGLKNVFSINSFTFGKQTLGPTIIDQFKKQGKEIKAIILDNPAKARLMAMSPSLKERVEKGESTDDILMGQPLELSLTITEDGSLYILGDKENLSLVEGQTEKARSERFRERRKILSAGRNLGLYDLGYTPAEATLWQTIQQIKDVEALRDKEIKIGPYTVTITDSDPQNFTLKINGA